MSEVIKIKYVGDYYKVYLKKGQIYTAVASGGLYGIYDPDDREVYFYDPKFFELVDETESLGEELREQ